MALAIGLSWAAGLAMICRFVVSTLAKRERRRLGTVILGVCIAAGNVGGWYFVRLTDELRPHGAVLGRDRD